MKTIISLYFCLGALLFAGCASERYINAVPGVRDITPKDTSKTKVTVAEINEDSTMILSERANLTIGNTKRIEKMQNFISFHVGIGSMNVKAKGEPWVRDNGLVTVHFDYEYYFEKAPGLGLGMFYNVYGEQSDNYQGNEVDLTIFSLGPQLAYKIRRGKVLLGVNFGGGAAILNTFSNYYDYRSGWQDNSKTTVGGVLSLGGGIEFLVSRQWSISLRYNHLEYFFSDKDTFATKDGKLHCKRDAFLIGAGFYF